MKFGYGEKDILATYFSGIEKFMAIAIMQDNRGESNVDALMQAKELMFEMRDFMSKNEEVDSKTETFAEYCARDIAAEQKLKGGDKT